MRPNTIDDFWQFVEKGSDCWLWTSTTNWAGYGAFRFRGKNGAHSASYLIHFGPIPKGMHVLHRCDIPQCVRPDHLFLGTHADNMRDMANKGRCKPASMPGESHPSAKLKANDVIEIRRRYAAGGIRQKDLAFEFGVTQPLVGMIIRRQAWRHL